MTIREVLNKVSDAVDFNDSNYMCSAIVLLFADGKERNFAVSHDNDKRREMYIVLGKDFSTFKHGHIKTVYCVLPREAVTTDIEKYRDIEDLRMYKYRLPEKMFNSILNRFKIDIDGTVAICRNRYAGSGYEWDGDANWRRKVQEWFGKF